jgi:transposase
VENLWGILAQEAERTYALLEHSSSEIAPETHRLPYSPDLNPIEKAWNKLKQVLPAAKTRNKLTRSRFESRTLAPN